MIVACGCAGIAAILGDAATAEGARPPHDSHCSNTRRTLRLRSAGHGVAGSRCGQGSTVAGVLIGLYHADLAPEPSSWAPSASSACDSWLQVVPLEGGFAWNAPFLCSFECFVIAWRSGTSHWIPRSRKIGRNPGRDLAYVLEPWGQGGSVTGIIVLSGLRSRSPLVEHACAVLIWARTRSLDGLISAIDDVLLPVGEAQLQVEEESLVTLTQQRAVTFAMSALMTVMFVSLVRVSSFRAYYDTFEGTVVLLVAVAMFFALIAMLGRIARTARWTRWDLRRVQDQELHPHG